LIQTQNMNSVDLCLVSLTRSEAIFMNIRLIRLKNWLKMMNFKNKDQQPNKVIN